MRTTLVHGAVILAVLSVSLVAAPAPAASGACAPQFDFLLASWRYRRCGVPDLDQKRNFLPNAGNEYCVPTSAMDWLTYMADRGEPRILPGPDQTSNYGAMDGAIGNLGMFMSTDKDKGTTTDNAMAGLRGWLELSLGSRWGDYVTVSSNYGPTRFEGFTKITEAPRGEDLAAASVNGALVMAMVGWWRHDGSYYVRDGGHMVALTSARPATRTEGGNSGDYMLGFNDPASDEGDMSKQSEWTTELHMTASASGPMQTDPLTYRREDVVYGGSYSASGWLDGAIQIMPKFGLFPDPNNSTATLRRRTVFQSGPPRSQTVDYAARARRIALDPTGVRHTALLDDGRLVAIGNVDGTTTEIGNYPSATEIVVDEALRTAILDRDGRITVLDRHGNPAWDVLVGTATGLSFNPRSHVLVTYDTSTSQIVAITDRGGSPLVRRYSTEPPPAAPIAAVSVNPVTGLIGMLESGTNRLLRATPTDGGYATTDEISLGPAGALEGLVADATGTWYSTRDGVVVAFDADGNEIADNPFAGQPSAPNFQIFQPVDIGTPTEGPNVLPEAAAQGALLTLEQARAETETGRQHDVMATLLDDAGAPMAGRTLAYEVSGANSVTGTVVTGDDGRAVISWTGSVTGVDQLVTWDDADADRTRGPAETMAGIETTWTDQVAIATETTLASSQNPSTAGQPVAFTATVTAADETTPTGIVRFTDNGADLGETAVDENGNAVLETGSLSVGSHHIEAVYAPAEGTPYTASSASLDQAVQCEALDLLCLVRSILGDLLGDLDVASDLIPPR